ncbi:MAG: hypothetical protein IKQ06_04000 [Bacilli bacterium]|nr:hypothetical protein [Bacilli bacterium]
MPAPEKGEKAYTKNANTGKTGTTFGKVQLQAIISDNNYTKEEGFKFDIDTVVNHPNKIVRDKDVLHEKKIDKDRYIEKLDGLSKAVQGALVCYANEEEILKKIVENSNSRAFETGTEATITLADVEKAYHDQDDINLNVLQTQNDMEDDLSVFGKFNRNLKTLKFLTKLKMLKEAAESINKDRIPVGSPYPKVEDVSNENWRSDTSYSNYVDDKYRDDVTIKVTYKDDPETGTSKKIVTKTTNRYIYLDIAKYYDKIDALSINIIGLSSTFVAELKINKYERLFSDVGLRERIPYLNDPDMVD